MSGIAPYVHLPDLPAGWPPGLTCGVCGFPTLAAGAVVDAEIDDDGTALRHVRQSWVGCRICKTGKHAAEVLDVP